jgi:hypothetical protein
MSPVGTEPATNGYAIMDTLKEDARDSGSRVSPYSKPNPNKSVLKSILTAKFLHKEQRINWLGLKPTPKLNKISTGCGGNEPGATYGRFTAHRRTRHTRGVSLGSQ